jgi:NAD(P)-dependent dehydrogenase (short-subunit alcohol dehydrogenase family)
MSRIFITGSADGIGKMIANLLASAGHQVVLHARNKARAHEAWKGVPGAKGVLTGDLSSVQQTIRLAAEVNSLAPFEAVIHNAGVGYREPKKITTDEGLSHLFAINVLAPYILTCLIQPPARLVFTGSGLHRQGNPSLDDLNWEHRPWSGYNAYADTKLYDMMLAFAVARKWTKVFSNAVEPGWVATKMGGHGAPDSLEEAPETQAWLATSEEPAAKVSGKYFYHKKLKSPLASTLDNTLQDQLLQSCERLSGVSFPAE